MTLGASVYGRRLRANHLHDGRALTGAALPTGRYGTVTVARVPSPPPFDQVKAQLATNLQQERYRQFLDDSLKASKTGQ